MCDFQDTTALLWALPPPVLIPRCPPTPCFRSKLQYLWSYLHVDTIQGEAEWLPQTEDDKRYGESYPLPLARLRARMFGGDVVVQSMEGLGLIRYAYIKKFDRKQLLPGTYAESFYEDDECSV